MVAGRWKLVAGQTSHQRPAETHEGFGPAAITSGPTVAAKPSKFSRNIAASFFACASYAAGSVHVCRGFKTSAGTSGQPAGISRLKIGSLANATPSSAPDNAARIIARV